jgi:hypothetical protein
MQAKYMADFNALYNTELNSNIICHGACLAGPCCIQGACNNSCGMCNMLQ